MSVSSFKYLCIIPARGGSKGIPYKNIKELNGVPLIRYTIDIARKIFHDNDICVSTDDDKIINTLASFGMKVPFKRPDSLATDSAGTYEVLLHAINHYEGIGKNYDTVVLLQPTTPFRKASHINDAISLYNKNVDMVVSVKESSSNPYYNCYEEDSDGCLYISKGDGAIERRQDAPKVWEYNGSIYIINVSSFKKMHFSEFTKVKKYVMDELYSIDIDTPFDWKIAELILQENMVEL